MKNGLDKFLSSDRLLYAIPWIFTVSVVVSQLAVNISEPELFTVFDFGLDIICLLSIFGITVSYKLHEKNIMKTLFGAIIAERIITYFYWFTYLSGNKSLFSDSIFSVIIVCFYIVLLVNHIILGYGHKANPERIRLNYVTGILIILTAAIWNFSTTDFIPLCISLTVYDASIILEILCIETKVDAYKIIRENK